MFPNNGKTFVKYVGFFLEPFQNAFGETDINQDWTSVYKCRDYRTLCDWSIWLNPFFFVSSNYIALIFIYIYGLYFVVKVGLVNSYPLSSFVNAEEF